MNRLIIASSVLAVVLVVALLIQPSMHPPINSSVPEKSGGSSSLRLEADVRLVPTITIKVNGRTVYEGVDPPTRNFASLMRLIFDHFSATATFVDVNGNSFSPQRHQIDDSMPRYKTYIYLGNGTPYDASQIWMAMNVRSFVASIIPTTTCYVESWGVYVVVGGGVPVNVSTTITEVALVTAVQGRYVMLFYTPLSPGIPVNAGDVVSVQYNINFVTSTRGAANHLCTFLVVGIFVGDTSVAGSGTMVSVSGISYTFSTSSIFSQQSTYGTAIYIGSGTTAPSPGQYNLGSTIRFNYGYVYTAPNGIDVISPITLNPGETVWEVGVVLILHATDSYPRWIMVLRYVLDTPVSVPQPTTIVVVLRIRW